LSLPAAAALLLAPVTGYSANLVFALGKILKRAKAAGIPVITWDSDLLERDKAMRAAYVGTNNYEIGVNLAKLVIADTLPFQMEILADGLSHGRVGQRPFEMGYRAMYVLKDIVDGKAVGDPIFTGLNVCTESNHSTCLAE